MIAWACRDATPDDLPFVFATWLRSARKQGDRAFMTNTVYFLNEKRRIGRLIETSKVAMICNQEDADHILGWVCHGSIADVALIHYAYVKRSYQGMGILRAALALVCPRLGKEQIAITSITSAVAEKRQKYQLHFNPYLTEIYGT